MTKNTPLRHSILWIMLLILIGSCKKKTSLKVDNLEDFKACIYQHSNQEISVKDPIVIGFHQDLTGFNAKEQVFEDIAVISPRIKGKWIAPNKNTLHFKPDTLLSSGTTYTVKIKLEKLFSNTKTCAKAYTFAVHTTPADYTLDFSNTTAYSKDYQYINATLTSADYITLKAAKQIISATQKQEKLPIKWHGNQKIAKQFTCIIDSIQRFQEHSDIRISWDGNPIKSETKGVKKIRIIGQNTFSLTEVKTKATPQQCIVMHFSDPINTQQDLQGLISINQKQAFKTIVTGNTIKIYPTKNLEKAFTLEIANSIKNDNGVRLKETFKEELSFTEAKPDIAFIDNGVILPSSKALTFRFKTINVKAVNLRVIKIFKNNILQFLQEDEIYNTTKYNTRKVGRKITQKTINLEDIVTPGRWKTHKIDLATIIAVEPGAIYQIDLGFDKHQAIYSCLDKDLKPDPEQVAYQKKKEQQYWDNKRYSLRNYDYNWRERNDPCTDSYYTYKQDISTNLIASNLGFIVKKSENNAFHFAVTDLLKAKPIAASKITLYNYQQQPIASANTDQDGFAIIDADENAYFATAENGKDTAYIKLEDNNSISLSSFAIDGTKLQEGLKGYVYAIRGVTRPGDSIHLGFILNDKANPLPKKHPIQIEVLDASYKKVYQKTLFKKQTNHYGFSLPTTSKDPTGIWQVNAKVGGAVFSKDLKVETIKPNRLKIALDFKQDILKKDTDIQADIQVNWLHGSPAAYAKTKVSAKISSATTAFKNFKNYHFSDPSKYFSTQEIALFHEKLDAQGKAKIQKKLHIGKNAPGMLGISFLTTAQENAGDISMDAFSKPYAPYASFVGIQTAKNQAHGALDTDKKHLFKAVCITPEQKPIANRTLEVTLYKVKWRWWWSNSQENLSSYTSGKYHEPKQRFNITTNAQGKVSFPISVSNDASGRYFVRITDPVDGHSTGSIVYFYNNWWSSANTKDKEAAKMLVFSTDKTSYNVGEKATISFASSANGRALISIENNTEVLEKKWVTTSEKQTTTTLDITKDMAPNVFIHISLIQPHHKTQNDLPIRLYGVVPIQVKDKNTILEPVLEMPKEIQPEKNYTITVREKQHKSMSYTLAIVDQGLLDLTRFKTPNPWDFFFAKQALGVQTWDMYDHVIGAYSASADPLLSIGGDSSGRAAKNKKANRFKPVVTYLGPFYLKQGQTKTHTLRMDNYIGAVRAMVIANNAETNGYGSVEKNALVKKPLMVLSSLPRKLSPTEKVTIPVTVFAMDKKIKKVKVTLDLKEGFTTNTPLTKEVVFDGVGEKVVTFDVNTTNFTGTTKVTANVRSGSHKASHSVAIAIKNPNSPTTKSKGITINPKQTKQITYANFGVAKTNSTTLELSTMPDMDYNGRLKYLITYPHGCVEQTTSSAFPQLFLEDLFDLSYQDKQAAKQNIEKAIKRLSNFQKSNGGLSYWPSENYISDWGTTYAGHFMVLAQKKGYSLPLGFMQKWLAYQKDAARKWRFDTKNNNGLIQAYRLYSLALAGQPDMAAMNRLRELQIKNTTTLYRLAAAYALTGHKQVATALIANKTLHPKENIQANTYGSTLRDKAMALETLVLLQDTRQHALSKEIAKQLGSNTWLSTQTTAYCLYAVADMVLKNGGKNMELSYTINGKTTKVTSTKPMVKHNISVHHDSTTITFTNHQNNKVFARVLTHGTPAITKTITQSKNLKAKVVYLDEKANPIAIENLKQGTNFTAKITLTNTSAFAIEDIALTHVLPSGWEIINTRFNAYGSNTQNPARYTDIRDDRTHFYFNLNKGSSKTFYINLHASYLGTYYLPALQASAMYNNDYIVRTKGKWIHVLKD